MHAEKEVEAVEGVEAEIADLEAKLRNARARRRRLGVRGRGDELDREEEGKGEDVPDWADVHALHALLLLADSALPLGSFAFSNGLESYLAHHPPRPHSRPAGSSAAAAATLDDDARPPERHFPTFLRLSLGSQASTTLPFFLAAYRHPSQLRALDDALDASTACTVARRASVTQGRALLGVWERSLRTGGGGSANAGATAAREALLEFQAAVRAGGATSAEAEAEADGWSSFCDLDAFAPSAHLAPLLGVVMRALCVPAEAAAYVFLFNHARTVTSAAVRAGLLGPYQAQAVLAGAALRGWVAGLVREGWMRGVEEVRQCVPVMDLWVGRHERVYSRVFNS